MVNAFPAGAARQSLSNEVPCAETLTVVPFAAHPVAAGGGAAVGTSPRVGLKIMRYRIAAGATTPIPATPQGLGSRRTASNCSRVTAFDPAAIARATVPTRW